MAKTREQLVCEAAGRGKYAALYRHLCGLAGRQWQASFADIEAILGFELPDSARLHRPWWRAGSGHSHAFAWQAAGWTTRAIDLDRETLVFERTVREPEPAETPGSGQEFDLDRDLAPHNPGPWPAGFTVTREQIYDDETR